MNSRLLMRKRVCNQQVKQLQTQVAFLWTIIIGLIMWSSWLQFFGGIY